MRGANWRKRVATTIGKKSEPINGGGGAPEAHLCPYGKHGSCTPKIFSVNCQHTLDEIDVQVEKNNKA